jgi:hypothetical protein
LALNDIDQSRNGVVVDGVAAVGEGSINVATSSKSGRFPVSRVRLRSQGTMRYAYKAGGPYVDLVANESAELGSFLPGDPTSIFHIRVGGADVNFDLEIWN